MVLLLALLLLLATSVVGVAAFPFERTTLNVLALWVACYGQIVIASQILSELRLIGMAGFTVVHIVMFALSVSLWFWRGRPPLLQPFRYDVRWLLRHRLLSGFGVVVLALTALNGLLAWVLPTLTLDGARYHLLRAHYWSVNGTARHFYHPDARLIDFPPNPAFIQMWLFGVYEGTYTLYFASQFIATLVTCAGIVALARACEHNRAASLFAALLFLTFPQIVRQAATDQIDAVTAATVVAFLAFALHHLLQRQGGAWAGAAFGLMLGTKYTVFFALPGMAIALIVVAVWRWGSGLALRLLVVLFAWVLLGFVTLGMYNYALNTLDFGNPITSQSVDAASGIFSEAYRDALYDGRANFFRYLYISFDWYTLPGGGTFWKNSAVFETFLAAFQRIEPDLEAPPNFTTNFVTNTHRGGSRMGYGVIGFVMLAASFVAAVGALIAARWWGKRALFTGLIIAVGVSWWVLFSSIAPYSHWRMRYMPLVMALLSAAMLPWVFSKRRFAFVVLLPILVVAIFQQAHVVAQFENRTERLQPLLAGEFGPLWQWQRFPFLAAMDDRLRELGPIVVAMEPLAERDNRLVGQIEHVILNRQTTFYSLGQEAPLAYLATGRADAVLIGPVACATADAIRARATLYGEWCLLEAPHLAAQ